MCYVILPEQLPLSAPAETKSLVIGTQSSGQFAFEITYGTVLVARSSPARTLAAYPRPDNVLHRHGVRFVKWREKTQSVQAFRAHWFAVAASHMRGDELLLIHLVRAQERRDRHRRKVAGGDGCHSCE
jgi:hypothetical protein